MGPAEAGEGQTVTANQELVGAIGGEGPASGMQDVELFRVPLGSTYVLYEMQVDVAALPYLIWDRAIAQIGSPPTFGDGRIFIRQGVAGAPDLPSTAQRRPAGTPNQNTLFGDGSPTTAPNPPVKLVPPFIKVPGGRQVCITVGPGHWEVRTFGLDSPSSDPMQAGLASIL